MQNLASKQCVFSGVLNLRHALWGSVAMAMSAMVFSSILFAGPFSFFYFWGVSGLLFGMAIMNMLCAFTFSLSGYVWQPRLFFVLALSATITKMSGYAAGFNLADRGLFVLLSIVCISVSFGVGLVLVKQIRHIDLGHFLPYPVLAGYFAGIGVSGVAMGIRYVGSSFFEFSGFSVSILEFAAPYDWFYFWNTGSISVVVSTVFSHCMPLLGVSAIAVFMSVLKKSRIDLFANNRDITHRDSEIMALGSSLVAIFGCSILFPKHRQRSKVSSHQARLTTFLTGLFCLVWLSVFYAVPIVIPKALTGILIVIFSFAILDKWWFKPWKRFPNSERLMLSLIAASVLILGYAVSLFVGIVISILFFIWKYSRVDVIRRKLSGDIFHSNVTRSMSDRTVLNSKGSCILIEILQGYIFFGVADRLYRQIRDQVLQSSGHLKYVILDLKHVTAVDSSGVTCFKKLSQFLHQQHIRLILTQMNQVTKRQFTYMRFFDHNEGCRCFDHLDYGIEWCEIQILNDERPVGMQIGFHSQLQSMLKESELVTRMQTYLIREAVPANAVLFEQGDPSHKMYIVESGSITLVMHHDQAESIRLQTMGAGTVFGEMGLYTRKPRSASAMADTDSVVYSLSRQSLHRMQIEDPVLSDAFYRYIVSALSAILARSNHVLTHTFVEESV